MPEKGHTHDTRERRKQAERNERKREQRSNNINHNIFIPQQKNQHIVYINKIYNGGTTVNVKFKNGNIEDVFIPGNCRLNKR